MLILITYDVDTTTKAGEKRLRRVAKECVNYGQRVQNSVFECLLTEAQLVNLKSILSTIINDTTDSIRIYHLGSNWQNKIETLGKLTSFDPTETLIIWKRTKSIAWKCDYSQALIIKEIGRRRLLNFFTYSHLKICSQKRVKLELIINNIQLNSHPSCRGVDWNVEILARGRADQVTPHVGVWRVTVHSSQRRIPAVSHDRDFSRFNNPYRTLHPVPSESPMQSIRTCLLSQLSSWAPFFLSSRPNVVGGEILWDLSIALEVTSGGCLRFRLHSYNDYLW